LVAYTGTILGAVIAFFTCFAAASNLAGATTRWVARRFLEFCRTVPEIVFALIFVLAYGLGPMAGVLALAIHTLGALGKLYTEIVENIDMKPVEGIISTGGSRAETIFYAVLPQVWSGFATYSLLRFEINFRGASIMGFVGAGGIGQELLTAVRKFYYSDVSAILVMIVATVFVLDILTGLVLKRLNRVG
jgi:phosphonate transport system permease protein